MSVGSPTAGTWSSSQWRPDNEFETDSLRIHVSHVPPGTSKWNTGEHRLFCHSTQNWRGRPLRTFETVVALIGHTHTATGLRVRAKLDKRRYKVGLVVPSPRCVACPGTRMSSTATGTMNCARGQLDHSIKIRGLRSKKAGSGDVALGSARTSSGVRRRRTRFQCGSRSRLATDCRYERDGPRTSVCDVLLNVT